MGLNHGTNIVKDGLVFYVDPINPRSWTGPDSNTVNNLFSNSTGSIFNDTSGSYGNNSSFALDGTDDYIDIGSSVVMGTSDYSFSSWVKTSDTEGIQSVIGTRNDNTNGWIIQITENSILFYNVKTPSNRISSDFDLTNGNWYNLVIVRGGTSSTNKIYVNGVSQNLIYNNENGTNPASTLSMKIGVQFHSGQFERYFNGNIGPTMIYSKKLSSQEVKQNYNALKSRFGL